MAEFVALARRKGAERVVLAATQACRRAADGAAFVAELGREFALDSARVLSGREEAGLARRGVLSRLTGPTQGALLADVGGGSTELSPLGEEGRMLSLPLGAVGLSEAHLTGDPPSAAELEALGEAVARGLAEAGVVAGRAARLVATAGTAAACASLNQGLTEYQPERIDNHTLGAGELTALLARLAALPLAQRRQVPGLEPERADIILAGIAILRGLLQALGLASLTAMNAGLLEGIWLEAASHPPQGEVSHGQS